MSDESGQVVSEEAREDREAAAGDTDADLGNSKSEALGIALLL